MNMEKKHTPGPWKTQMHISLDRMEIRDANGRRIAECAMVFPMSAKTHEANASLIAAAPELLDALRMVIAHDGRLTGADWDTIRAAVDKAEGGAAE